MRNPLTPVIAVVYLAVAGIAVLWSWIFNDLTFSFIRGDDPMIWLRHLGMGAAAGLLIVILTTLATENLGWARAVEDEFRKILGPFELREAALVALSSGIAEELLFRGAIQDTVGLWPASIVFGLLHVGPGARYLPWTLYAIAAGFFFGVLYDRGGLAPVVLAHVLVNFCGFARTGRRDRDELFLS